MMTTLNRATPETRVIEAAREYATWRSLVAHLDSRGAARTCMDPVRLFDALELAEKHLLVAVKHLPKCLSDDKQDSGSAGTTGIVGGN